jgi:hypothetical protein
MTQHVRSAGGQRSASGSGSGSGSSSREPPDAMTPAACLSHPPPAATASNQLRLRYRGAGWRSIPIAIPTPTPMMRASGCTTDRRVPRCRGTTAVVVVSEAPDAPSGCRSRGRTTVRQKGSDVSAAPGPSNGRGRAGPVDYDDRYPADAGPLTTTTTANRSRVRPPDIASLGTGTSARDPSYTLSPMPQRGNGMKPRVAAFAPLPWVGRPTHRPQPQRGCGLECRPPDDSAMPLGWGAWIMVLRSTSAARHSDGWSTWPRAHESARAYGLLAARQISAPPRAVEPLPLSLSARRPTRRAVVVVEPRPDGTTPAACLSHPPAATASNQLRLRYRSAGCRSIPIAVPTPMKAGDDPARALCGRTRIGVGVGIGIGVELPGTAGRHDPCRVPVSPTPPRDRIESVATTVPKCGLEIDTDTPGRPGPHGPGPPQTRTSGFPAYGSSG